MQQCCCVKQQQENHGLFSYKMWTLLYSYLTNTLSVHFMLPENVETRCAA